jgi:hypothetical protein
VTADATDEGYFGQWIAPLFFAGWVIAQAGVDPAQVETEFEFRRSDRHGLARVDLEMQGNSATVQRDAERCVLTTNVDGHVDVPEGVTRSGSRGLEELIVRELKQPASDAIFRKVLPIALALSQRVRR